MSLTGVGGRLAGAGGPAGGGPAGGGRLMQVLSAQPGSSAVPRLHHGGSGGTPAMIGSGSGAIAGGGRRW
jgi:hypothetical protein